MMPHDAQLSTLLFPDPMRSVAENNSTCPLLLNVIMRNVFTDCGCSLLNAGCCVSRSCNKYFPCILLRKSSGVITWLRLIILPCSSISRYAPSPNNPVSCLQNPSITPPASVAISSIGIFFYVSSHVTLSVSISAKFFGVGIPRLTKN